MIGCGDSTAHDGTTPDAGRDIASTLPDGNVTREDATDADSGAIEKDAADADGRAIADADAGLCCPISPTPACCMQYGGTRERFGCGTTCDGMPWPSYPGWERRIDANGCPYWWTPPDAPRGCGVGFPDARADADAQDPEPDARTDGDAPDVDPDAPADGDARDDSDGSRCCPISPAPACCMAYGGSQFCGTVCDGMPWPDYPGWERRIDANGCPYWWTPPGAPVGCGGVVPEPRVDGAAPDTLSDAPADADAEGSSPDASGGG